MKVYTIDNNGFIIGIKDVGKQYIMNPNDIKGEPTFKINHHYETGIKRPKTQEQLDNERILVLRQLISDKKLLDEPCTEEQAELKTLLGI